MSLSVSFRASDLFGCECMAFAGFRHLGPNGCDFPAPQWKYQRIRRFQESAIPCQSSFPEMAQLPSSISLLLFWDNGLGTLLEL